MLRAGALYFSIVIAFFIAILSASIIMLAAHYRNSYLKEMRFNSLNRNMSSALVYVLADTARTDTMLKADLFGQQSDSVQIDRQPWGIYQMVQVNAFIGQDTLTKTMLLGKTADTTVLYLADEDRPLSLSGKTRITGNAVLPKAGLKKSYAEGKPYDGDKLIYHGKTVFSKRSLPPLDKKILDRLGGEFLMMDEIPALMEKTLKVSFRAPTKIFRLAKHAALKDCQLDGNIILYADSSITVAAGSKLNGVQVYAPHIKLEDGFIGNGQFFATDSISIGKDAYLSYPSAAGVLRTKNSGSQPVIKVGENTVFEGVIFSYEAERSSLQTLVDLGKGTQVKGEVYSTGLLKLAKGVQVLGKVTCNRFIMKTPTTLYENFLIDVTFNNRARSKYYLSSSLLGNGKVNQVMSWLH